MSKANAPTVDELLYNVTRSLTPREMQRFRAELERRLPTVLEEASRAARQQRNQTTEHTEDEK